MEYDYDIVVIGGGAAGLVAATGAAGLGARTALIEKKKLGGDCTWYGCIPSKALLKSGQVFSLVKRLEDFGIRGPKESEYDPAGVMVHLRDIIAKISTHHPPEVFEKRGIKVLFGDSKFIDSRGIELDGRYISSRRFIICTGSHPLVPPIEGLKNIPYLTNENIFDLETLPKSIAILGGGPIGVELSQAFCRLGVEVSIVEMAERILLREDAEIAAVLTDTLLKEGVKIYSGKRAIRFSKEINLSAVTLEDKDKKQSVIKAEKILVAVGRAGNVQGLDLEKAGVKYSANGIIEVDDTLRTTAKNMYACGDVAGPYQFSHMAEYQAVIAVINALFPFKQKVDYRAVAWCTFTDPELAHLGFTEEEARARYKCVRVYKSAYAGNDRAVTDLEETGLAKAVCDKKGRILGAHVVGANAGEIIHEYVLAKSAKLNISKLSSTIHVYPTLSQVIKRTADQYYLDMMNSGWFKKISRFFVGLLKSGITATFLIFLAQGCVLNEYREQIGTLQDLEKNQRETQEYVQKEEEGFNKLRYDIKNNRLERGTAKSRILSDYGDPVFCEEMKGQGEDDIQEKCLYRYPLQYFSADKIYLYFDRNDTLSSWKVEISQ